MSLIKTIDNLRSEIKNKSNGKTINIGFVPTMGYLHEGHLSLIKRAKKENDLVVVSVFVNPTQFGANEDLDNYPRDIETDYKLAIDSGADIVFNPEVEEMYRDGNSTYVIVEGEITKKLCGASRSTHFRGVTTVVAKLLNIVKPTNAYFGQKDAQQVAVIEKIVRDLDFDVNIIPCELIRENDGLALSSRNVYLSEEERDQALILSKSLFKAKELFLSGERNSKNLKGFIISKIKTKNLADIDYVEIVHPKTLESIDNIEEKALIALAVRFGKTRLIDNIYLEV
ncbi:pantothenate synthetase PanC [Gottschalkia acidurici 9a]|uniref:Pantothenate synthetase n=1 Tax=Gottschalkia acidurici (strain ATCC 7906 / DSM 604 / BCRC 14475 / CIP 104303 / KCTC 5404 / NCIMB 10678 / 9a) TaxID=1128398 RepID=K0B3V0_GOTA9|nr:pantoate--beta-alanine ligase [Gottschalkia acidurici]AFS79580.1 pantothenate synthetase PanC [Gottschalkia acidurici 9a]